MEFLPEEIESYALMHTTDEDPVLQELFRETHLKILRPRMLSGHLQGKILEMMSQMIQPKNILEIGTYTGYSAICLAKGLSNGGKLHTIDINDELSSIVLRYIKLSENTDKIIPYIGNALQIIPTLNQIWDLVFIDADKENYSNYFDLVIDNVRQGGFIVADNVLWSGKVTNMKEQDEETLFIRSFNEKIKLDNRVEQVLIPVRDGLTVMRKK
jgi:caffeoyl-CoA O-methyltransferase